MLCHAIKYWLKNPHNLIVPWNHSIVCMQMDLATQSAQSFLP